MKKDIKSYSLFFLTILVLAFYGYITYSMFTYINDVNKVDECKNILPFHKNLIWYLGFFRFSVICVVIFLLILILFL